MEAEIGRQPKRQMQMCSGREMYKSREISEGRDKWQAQRDRGRQM